MLAPLDNETIFKKAFTNKEVFQQFIKDLFGVDITVNKGIAKTVELIEYKNLDAETITKM